MLHHCKRHTRKFGVIGPSILIAGAVIAAVGYAPVEGHGYSFLNRTISSLGDPRQSQWSYFFNWGMIVGATLMALFTLGVGLRIKTKRSPRITAVGVLGSLGMALVGVFPDTPPTEKIHLAVAGVALVCTLWLGAGFTLDTILNPQPVLPRWLIIPGALAAACSGSFLVVMIATRTQLLPKEVLHFGQAGPRPMVDLLPTLEWSVLFSILLWAFLTAAAFREEETLQAQEAVCE